MPTALVLYHYLHPDDVVSAVHLGELCQGLRERGWSVTARPCNRGCRDESVTYPAQEDWNGVTIKRVWRPRFRQASTMGRLLNAAWMIGRWSLEAMRPGPAPDVLIVGTDPILSMLTAPVWKLLRPNTKIAHWCFDLYPEAAFSDGLLKRDGIAARLLGWALKRAYAACDLNVDIGPCMRGLLGTYASSAQPATLVPWALEEPAAVLRTAQAERAGIFGEAKLTLMYSGSFGRAHESPGILELARKLRNEGVEFAFSVRGNREKELRDSVTSDDTNIRFVPFAAADKLQDRLAAPDVHIVSLRREWTGTVVPSKFFGALAIGRPVIFFGSEDSAIAKWIEQHRVGWVWKPEQNSSLAAELRALANDAWGLKELSERCHRVYTQHFASRVTVNAWHRELVDLLPVEARESFAAAEDFAEAA